MGIAVQRGQPRLRLRVRREIGEVHVSIPALEQRLPDGRIDSGLVRVEAAAEDQIEGLAGLGLVLVVPARVVPGAAVLDLGGRQPEEEEVVLSRGAGISIVAPSRVPTVRAPFIMNFMLPVPLAS